MKILSFGVIALSLILSACPPPREVPSAGGNPASRQPAVAGTFYPADPKELAKMIDGFLAKAAPPPLENVVALVAPHAGYQYRVRLPRTRMHC